MPKPKKGDPELLLVSFCDIVTITTAAMFMAMIVVIDESSRIPAVRPMPMLQSTTNMPVYFECRAGQVFVINREKLAATFQEEGRKIREASLKKLGGDIQAVTDIMHLDAGDEFYRLDERMMLMGVMALIPRPDAKGTTIEEILNSPNNAYRAVIDKMDVRSQYCAFLVRDDAFEVFRRARDTATSKRFYSGWDFLEPHENITFAGLFAKMSVQ